MTFLTHMRLITYIQHGENYMSKLRKFMIALCIATGVSCLAGAAACTASAPEYYSLTAEATGVDVVFIDNMAEFRNGGTVKEGVNVRFRIEMGSNTTGEPAVKLNDTVILPDADGVYSFTMTEATVIKVDNVSMLGTLTFNKSQPYVAEDGNKYDRILRMTYTDTEGNNLYSGMVDGEQKDESVVAEYTVRTVIGEPFSFKINMSSYYVQDYDVSYNTEVLTPDANGVYTIESVDGNATISVTGVEEEESFLERRDGDGTAENPFLLRRPIDLYNMAAVVNGSYFVGYNMAYYKLAADIDMKGEQLYVAGDASNSTAVFCGTFDGDGHTISNFYITDEVVDQSTFANEYLPYVGLFGYAAANTASPAVIKNVTLSNYEVITHPGAAGAGVYVGSLLGYGIGVQVSGCKLVNGSVSAEGDDNQMICMGGVAGVLQAAYSSSSTSLITYDSYVYGCGTDVEIIGSGSPRSAGGVVGYLISADMDAIAYVADCYALGNVNGGMHVGGIVGTLGMFSSVANCYATGEVIANNYLSMQGLSDEFKGAYAGGIVGYAENDTVVSNCYSGVPYTYAQSSNGAAWQATGEIYAKSAAAGEISVISAPITVLNCVTSSTSANDETFKNTLGWSEREWAFNGTYPTLNAISGDVSNKITITVKNGDATAVTAQNTVGAGYSAMCHWYSDGVLDEYLENTSDGRRSWGYYFDKELTNKVPNGYVPTRDMTLYVGFADYSEVTGRYYLDSAGAVSDDTLTDGRITDFKPGSAYIELLADGTANFRYGGMTYTSVYTYDGQKVTLLYSAILSSVYTDSRTEGSFYTFTGTLDDKTLTLNAVASLVQSTSGETTTYGEVNVTVTAIKEEDLGIYGTYYGSNRTVYYFAKDGNGTATTSGGTVSSFTFSLNDDGSVTCSLGNVELAQDKTVSRIGGATVTKLDDFYGTWVTSDNATQSVTFDGRGTVTYNYFSGSPSTTYTVSDGVATYTLDGTAHTAEISGGLLVIDGVTYAQNKTYAGRWFYSNEKEQIVLDLKGIGTEGYGQAVISYMGGVVRDVAAEYDVTKTGTTTYIRVYVDNILYGELAIGDTASQKIISGTFFSLHNDSYYASASFYLYDNFEGTWTSTDAQYDSITFNGKGAYNVAASGSSFAIYGTVSARTSGGSVTNGRYTLTSAVAGTVTLGGKTYTLTYDETVGTFTLTGNDLSVTFARRDSWYGVVLYDASGASYTFDGKGYVGGTVRTAAGDLGYTLEGDMPVIDGTKLVANGQTFAYGDKQLSLKTGFAGEWIASGNRPLTITEADSSFVSVLTFGGQQYEFTYNPQDGTLVRIGATSVDKAVVKLLGSYELGVTGLFEGDDSYISCIVSSQEDGWTGTYTAADGSSYTFDGLGKAVYGTGTVVYKSGSTEITYTYKVDSFGTPSIRENNITKIFVRTNGTDGYDVGGVKYAFVEPDSYYGIRATAGETAYYFDGGNTLYVSTDGGASYEMAYVYDIVSDTEVTLTSGDTVKKGTLTRSGNYYNLEITDAE